MNNSIFYESMKVDLLKVLLEILSAISNSKWQVKHAMQLLELGTWTLKPFSDKNLNKSIVKYKMYETFRA